LRDKIHTNNLLTSVTHRSPIRYEIKHTIAMNNSFRFLSSRGHSSTAAVMKPSMVQNWNATYF